MLLNFIISNSAPLGICIYYTTAYYLTHLSCYCTMKSWELWSQIYVRIIVKRIYGGYSCEWLRWLHLCSGLSSGQCNHLVTEDDWDGEIWVCLLSLEAVHDAVFLREKPIVRGSKDSSQPVPSDCLVSNDDDKCLWRTSCRGSILDSGHSLVK